MTLDLDSLHLADESPPLMQGPPLEAQESEDGGVGLLLTLLLLLLSHLLQVVEPSTLDHQLFDLFGLLFLVPCSRIQAQGIEGLPLQSQVDRVSADLPVESDLLSGAGIEHDAPEGFEQKEISHGEQRLGDIGSLLHDRSLFNQA